MTAFHEVRFPDNIAYCATGGPEFATTTVATSAGHEKRNVNWAEARGRWDGGTGLKNQQQLDQLIGFFRARKGRAYGFRFKDWTDTGRAPSCSGPVTTLRPSSSWSSPAVISTPAAGGVPKVMSPVVVWTDQPAACSMPSR